LPQRRKDRQPPNAARLVKVALRIQVPLHLQRRNASVAQDERVIVL
jgi:hypothetical protein